MTFFGKTIEDMGTHDKRQLENVTPFIKFTYIETSRLLGSCEVGSTKYLYLQKNGLYKRTNGALVMVFF